MTAQSGLFQSLCFGVVERCNFWYPRLDITGTEEGVGNLSTRNSIDSGCEAATYPALRQIVVTNPYETVNCGSGNPTSRQWRIMSPVAQSAFMSMDGKFRWEIQTETLPLQPSFFAKSSARRCVYRLSIASVLCPDTLAASIGFNPFSNSRDTASWRRS